MPITFCIEVPSASNESTEACSPSASKRLRVKSPNAASPLLPGLRLGKRVVISSVMPTASAPSKASGAIRLTRAAGRSCSENDTTATARRVAMKAALYIRMSTMWAGEPAMMPKLGP